MQLSFHSQFLSKSQTQKFQRWTILRASLKRRNLLSMYLASFFLFLPSLKKICASLGLGRPTTASIRLVPAFPTYFANCRKTDPHRPPPSLSRPLQLSSSFPVLFCSPDRRLGLFALAKVALAEGELEFKILYSLIFYNSVELS